MQPSLSLPFLALFAGALGAQTSAPLAPADFEEKPPWIAPPKEPLPQAPGAQAPPQDVRPPRALPAGLPKGGLSVQDRVYFDTPGDGALWAGGRDYKIRFDAGGPTYYPRAARSPRNLPVGLRLADVRLAGEALAFDAQARPARDGQRVVYDRGAFDEVYALEPGQVEQLFVLHERPGAGELVLRIEVETELDPVVQAGSLRFRDAFVEVDYTRAVAVDARGAKTPLETELTAQGIDIRVPAAFAAAAEWPLTVDPVITTVPIDTTSAEDYYADTAWDSQTQRWVVVWERVFTSVDRDIYALLVDPNGPVPGSGEYIDYTVDDWRNPSVANNYLGVNFLVVAEEGADGARVISGRTRSAADTSMSAQFLVNDDSGEQLEPVVGGDPSVWAPTHYCVVWRRVFSSSDHDIHGQLVSSTGALVGVRFFIDNTAGTIDTHPDISKSLGDLPPVDQHWNVVWQRQFSTNDQDIRGAQVHFDGTITTASFPIDISGYNDRFPSASSPEESTGGPSHWVAAYQRDQFGTQEVHATLLLGGTLVIGVNVTDVDGSPAGKNSYSPSVDSDGTRFLVAYTQEGPLGSAYAYATTFHTPDLQLDEAHVLLDGGLGVESLARVSANHAPWPTDLDPKFFIVWAETDGTVIGGDHDIRGARFDTLAPTNDRCATAEHISGTGVFAWSNIGASTDGDPILGSCLNHQNVYNDVWYRWSAPSNAVYSVSTCAAATLDTALGVYAGTACPTDPVLACGDDECGVQSQVHFTASQNEPFLIRLGSSIPGGESSGYFRISLVSTDGGLGESFCLSGPNSTTIGSSITAGGSTSASANDLSLFADHLPPNKPGVFYFGTQTAQVPFGDGYRCVGGQTFRLPVVFSNGAGNASFAVDNGVPPATNLGVGLTWNFQFWYRDPNGPGGSGFNLSNGRQLTFVP